MKAEIADRKHDCHKSRVDIYFVSGFRSNENRILNKLLSENHVCCLCFKHNRGILDDRFLTNKSAHCVSVMLRSANPSIRRNELIKHRFPIYRRCSAPLHFPKQILTILCIKSADEGERGKDKISPVEQNLGNNSLHNAMSSTFWDIFSQFKDARPIFFDGCILPQLVMWSLENGIKKNQISTDLLTIMYSFLWH